MKYILNSENNLFLVRKVTLLTSQVDDIIPLLTTGISKVLWSNDNKAKVIMGAGGVDDYKILDSLDEDFSLVIKNANYGPADDFSLGKVLFEITNCKVTRKWFIDPVPASVEEQSLLVLWVYIQGTIKVNWDDS